MTIIALEYIKPFKMNAEQDYEGEDPNLTLNKTYTASPGFEDIFIIDDVGEPHYFTISGEEDVYGFRTEDHFKVIRGGDGV